MPAEGVKGSSKEPSGFEADTWHLAAWGLRGVVASPATDLTSSRGQVTASTKGGGGIPEGRGRGARLPEENKATLACTETTHGHGRAGKGNGPSISFQVTHGWRDAGCTDKLGLGARALEGRKVWCEWDIRQARNGRTPPFPRTGTGQTPSKSQILFSDKKRDEEERTDHLHQPCVSPQTCPPSLIETSLVRN